MAHVTAVAAAAGRSSHKPPALSMSFSPRPHSRSQSTSSSASSRSNDEPETSALSALDSSAALILVNDHDEADHSFNFSDDEGDRDDDDDIISPLFEVRKSVVFPPLPPSLVFLYLLSPYLKLGALDLPNSQLPLKYGLPALLFSALASAFSRQIWYMLARYLRKADMSDIVIDTFARGRGKERQREIIRFLVRTGTGAINIILSVTYMRHAMFTLQPLMSTSQYPTLTYVLSSFIVGIVVAYLSYARALSSRRVVYTTWLSVALYVAWLGCTIFAHAHGLLEVKTGWLGAGLTWEGLTTTAFAFCSSSTLPLYISLKGTSTASVSTAKTPRTRSFPIISSLSVTIAVLCLLPSVIFTAFPNHPAPSYLSVQQFIPGTNSNIPDDPITPATTAALLLNTTRVPVLPSFSSSIHPEITLPTIALQTVRDILASASLILGVPTLIVTTPALAIPSLRSVKFNVSRVLITLIVLTLAFIPPYALPLTGEERPSFLFSSSIFFAVLTIVLILMTLISTYFLPALLHVLTHTFKRPLAIVVPPRTPLLQHNPPGSWENDNDGNSRLSPRSIADDLLLRKERALQQRQFRKRIVWDIGVWVLLGTSAVSVVAIGAGLVGVW